MKTMREYLKEKMGVEMPEGIVDGDWFVKNHFPLIVSCACCHSTTVSLFAKVDEDGNLFCSSCVSSVKNF